MGFCGLPCVACYDLRLQILLPSSAYRTHSLHTAPRSSIAGGTRPMLRLIGAVTESMIASCISYCKLCMRTKYACMRYSLADAPVVLLGRCGLSKTWAPFGCRPMSQLDGAIPHHFQFRVQAHSLGAGHCGAQTSRVRPAPKAPQHGRSRPICREPQPHTYTCEIYTCICLANWEGRRSLAGLWRHAWRGNGRKQICTELLYTMTVRGTPPFRSLQMWMNFDARCHTFSFCIPRLF